MSIEADIYDYLDTNLDYHIDWGKINPDHNPKNEVVVSFLKLPSMTSQTTPTFLNNYQISIRGPQISEVTAAADEVMNLFILHTLTLGDYRVVVNNIENLGSIYEAEDIVHIPLELSLKQTGL